MIVLVVLMLVLSNIGSLAAGLLLTSFEIKNDSLYVQQHGRILQVSLRSPALQLAESTIVGDAPPLGIAGVLADGEIVKVSFAPISIGPSASIETTLWLQWSEAESVLRKWASLRSVGAQTSQVILKEVILERIDVKDRPVATHGQQVKEGTILLGPHSSHPVFMPGVFLGIEFPAASTRCENGQVVLAHRPGIMLETDKWYKTRKAVYGMATVGKEKMAFHRYIAAHRPKPQGIHFNYNSWWTSRYPDYTETEILDLMKVWEEKLWKARGVALDSFCIDLGWSDRQSIWEINHERFPAKFTRLHEAAQRMGSNLGLWISPSSNYPQAIDHEWAMAQGYETLTLPNNVRRLCLGGPRYAEQFQTRLANMVGRYGMSHLKFDGIVLECSESNHGHEPGPLSCELIAEGMIAALKVAREANPDVWLEPTCFGFNASPWWLFYANSVLGAFGDDAPAGRVPAPVYRESYTSARDFFNLQGAYLLPTPINAQELLGIVHQTPEAMTNDAVMAVLRGNMFLSLYVNPKFMDEARWDALAGIIKWARNNEETLQETVPLLPVSWQGGKIPHFTNDGVMPREPYGYAHIKGVRGLVALRNPWIAPQSYKLKIDEHIGFSPGAKELSVVSLYPEARLYAKHLKFGDTLEVALAPYETIVLTLDASSQAVSDVPPASTVVRTQLTVEESQHNLQRVRFTKSATGVGPDWTSRVGDTDSAIRLTIDANVRVTAPQAELLILIEGEEAIEMPVGELSVNGRKVQIDRTSSWKAWFMSSLPTREHWTFLRAPLELGDNSISLNNQLVGDDCNRISAWVWGTKSGERSAHPNALPAPELVSLDGVALFPAKELAGLPAKSVQIDRPVDRIEGVFLDALEPVTVSQDVGTLQRNRCHMEKPLVIGARSFLRGLGTHAPSKIVFSLAGEYRRFQSWAGADASTSPTVTFEVWVDGKRKWHSQLMSREDSAEWIDLDVTGAKTLELVVGNAGDSTSDHADWADAKLLR